MSTHNICFHAEIRKTSTIFDGKKCLICSYAVSYLLKGGYCRERLHCILIKVFFFQGVTGMVNTFDYQGRKSSNMPDITQPKVSVFWI